VVILTTLEDSDRRREGMDAGADAYLIKKELKPGQLLATIRDLLGRGGRAAAG
jgi:DNA-binding response OmpR family regulator